MVQYTKLKLSGFKSFPYPEEIEIGPGKTGVVGPNGCGKSNLLEALGWVMGETSAKRLRGDGMEDVIFNGTDRKAARTSAEVTLILDNSDGTAPPPYMNEPSIEVTRKISRGQGSDYSINGKSVRAKDVQLLFADLVSGANSPALVSQGRITGIIRSKPKDRRRILEDAAGISGLHARRHEAELRLRATTTNLERLDDIIGTSETQLASLKKQARQAAKYRNISEEISSLEAALFYKNWTKTSEDLTKTKKEFDELESVIRGLMAEITTLSKTQAEQAASLPDLRNIEAEKSAILQRAMIQLENLENDLEQRKASYKEKEESLNRLKQDQADILAQKERSLSKQDLLKEELTELQNAETDFDETKLETEIEALKDELKEKQQSFNEKRNKQAVIQSEIEALQNQKIGLESQTASYNEEEKKYEQRLETLQSKQNEKTLFDGLKKDIEAEENNILKLQQKRDGLEDQKTEIEIAYGNQQHVVNELLQNAQRLDAECDALEQILNSSNADKSSDTPIEETFINKTQVTKGYEKAFAIALGEGLDYSSNNEASIYWSELGLKELDLSLPEGTKPLTDFVKAPAELSRVLSQIGMIDDNVDGNVVAHDLKAGQMIVNKKGQLWRWDGFVIQGEVPSNAAVKLQQKNRLKDLLKQKEKASSSLEKERSNLNDIEGKREALETSLKELRQNIREIETSINDKRKRLGSMEQEMSELERDLVAIKTSLERIIENRKATQEQSKDVSDRLSIKTKIKNEMGDLDANLHEINELETCYQEARSSLETQKRESDRTRLRQEQIERSLEEISQDLSRLEEKKQDYSLRIEEMQKRLDEVSLAPAHSGEEKEKLNEKIHELKTIKKQAEEVRIAAEGQLRETENNLRDKERKMSDQKERRGSLQTNYQNLNEKKEELETLIQTELECQAHEIQSKFEIEQILNDGSLSSISQLSNRITNKKSERDRIGPVNLRAEIELEELETEIENLRYEESELITAIHKLRGVIGKLNKEARTKLLEAFQLVDNHFRKLFADLFGGGKAYLQLTEADDPLDAGLEIFAQPPGKKLQNLSLLSGGEQTLTSIALVFAMFLTNPSPICVLDEIDAALDDANVDRVCNLLDKIASRGETRFLIISHHRMSIARMDRLYGVTMAERGISQLVSVDLTQGDLWAEEHLNKSAA
ncbi:MAG: chromosome segregation protein SMC [Rickettsiales bacterium]|nr:chromosome segregation protein SMC [Rickettsiales bacterium]